MSEHGKAAQPSHSSHVKGNSSFDESKSASQTRTTTTGSLADTDPAYRIGPYQIEREVGFGGSGSVFRAIDSRDGKVVAVKLLRSSESLPQDALQRFRREATMLAKINHSNVVKFIDAGFKNGLQYIVTEFIDGANLAQRLHEAGRFTEQIALRLITEVALALVSAHEQGIVHRDIKPENILLRDHTDLCAIPTGAVKLTDFGLARVRTNESSMTITQTGAILGTPAYMAPEQGGPRDQVGPAADVYSVGATLFHLIAGRPPFLEQDSINLIMQHRHESPPLLSAIVENVSPGTVELVAKALSKRPCSRHVDATELLADLRRILDGEPTEMSDHPKAFVDQRHRSLEYEFRWELESPARSLWPLVSNTERLNEAINLPAVDFVSERDADGVLRRYGAIRLMAMQLRWEEHPFEWIEGQRLAVERDFSAGPFRSLVSEVELYPQPSGKTDLVHRITVQPRGMLGRAAATIEIGVKARSALARVYRHIDDSAAGRLTGDVDAFGSAKRISRRGKQILDRLLARYREQHSDKTELADAIGRYVANASPQELSRIRTLEFAYHFGFDANDVLEAFLSLTHNGLFELLWDVICPTCRVTSEIHATLRDVQSHAHCPACDLAFDVDFSRSVELIFRTHGRVRCANTGVYCIGGPSHAPHVCVQARMHPGERLSLELNLAAGCYLLRSERLTTVFEICCDADAERCDIDLKDDVAPKVPSLKADTQTIRITNHDSSERLVKIERDVPREYVLSAVQAAAFPAFRQMFPHEILSPGQMVSVRQAVIVASRITCSGNVQTNNGQCNSPSLHTSSLNTSSLNTRSALRLIAETALAAGAFAADREGDVLILAFCNAVAAASAISELFDATIRELTKRNVSFAFVFDQGTAYVSSNGDGLECYGPTPDAAKSRVQAIEDGQLIVCSPALNKELAGSKLLKYFDTRDHCESGITLFYRSIK